jgi:menaquinone-dependent protoporphyrinogen oxidase
MQNRILIVYASKYGSTAEIAEYIGQVLRNMGIEVDVSSVNASSSAALSGWTSCYQKQ